MRRRLGALLATLSALLLTLTLLPASSSAVAMQETGPAPAATPLDVRVITYNMNQFRRDERSNRVADLQRLLIKTDVLLIQEAQGFDIAGLVASADEGARFRVLQAGDRESAQAGSVIAVRRAVLGSGGVQEFGFLEGVRGATKAECNNHPSGGHGPRWIAKARLHLTNGTRLWVASAHVPPPRCHDVTLTPMMNSIKSFLRSHRNAQTVMGADWNLPLNDNPQNVWGGDTGYKRQAPGRSIDGFVLTTGLRVTQQAEELAKRPPGDHHPVVMAIEVA